MLIIPIIQNDFQGKVYYTRHACRAIIINKGKILLSYESKNDKYLIPGGGIEENESLIDCCKREVLEEGRKIRQNNDSYRERMEKIKQEKIRELKALNIQPKYIADLERFKIV